MFAVSLTPWLLNSALWSTHQLVKLKLRLAQNDHPSDASFKLNT